MHVDHHRHLVHSPQLQVVVDSLEIFDLQRVVVPCTLLDDLDLAEAVFDCLIANTPHKRALLAVEHIRVFTAPQLCDRDFD